MSEERFASSMMTFSYKYPPLYVLTHPQAFRPYASDLLDENETDEACARFEQTVQSRSIRYDSPIPLQIYRSTLYHTTFLFPFLFVIVLCAGTYAREKACKSEQITVPTAMGEWRINAAKCMANLVAGIIVMLLPIIISLLVTRCFYPFPDLSLDVGIWSLLRIGKTALMSFLSDQLPCLIGILCTLFYCTMISCFTKSQVVTLIAAMALSCVLPLMMLNAPEWLAGFLPYYFAEPVYLSDTFWTPQLCLTLWIGLTILSLFLVMVKGRLHRFRSK